MLDLQIALGDTPTVRALKEGRVEIDGVNPDFVEVKPIIAAFRRMVRETAYDVCEMAPTTYLIAKAHGAKFTALPIVLMRRFHHGGLVKHPDGGVDRPKDLEGKIVGVRAYSVTTGVWTRGILQNDYDVDPTKVRWMVDDEEHVAQMQLPPNVVQTPPDRSLADMMLRGELAAAFTGNAGIGRAGDPTRNWSSSTLDEARYSEVIPDFETAEADWFARTGVYPIHAVVVVKNDLLDAHPWLAKSLLDAFEASKRPHLTDLRNGTTVNKTDERYIKDMKIVGNDPLPFGMAGSATAIDMLIKIAFQQGLIPEQWPRGDVFFNI